MIALVEKRTLTTAFPRLGEKLGVALQLAADHVLEAGRDVAPDVLGADGVALDEALDRDYGLAWNCLCIDDCHCRSFRCVAVIISLISLCGFYKLREGLSD